MTTTTTTTTTSTLFLLVAGADADEFDVLMFGAGSKLYTFGGNNQYVDWEAFAWVVERYDDMFEFNLENNTWTEITNEVQNRPERRFVPSSEPIHQNPHGLHNISNMCAVCA
eukprot:3187118-Rhodomonas_salina.1